MSNYKFILYSKINCPYSMKAKELLNNVLNNDNYIEANTVNELKDIINTKNYNIENKNKYDKHNTAPLVFYGTEEKIFFIGGCDELNKLIDYLKNDNKIYYQKLILNN